VVNADARRRGQDGAAYSSVVISNAGGVKQYIQLVGRGVISADAKTGKLLWGYNDIANDTANIPTPVVKGDYIFASTGYGAGGALLRVSKQGQQVAPREVYFLEAKQMQNHHGGMVMVGDYIYCGHGHDLGFPLCIELKTGREMWKADPVGEGSAAVVYADGQLYFRYQNGIMALIEATPKAFQLNGKFKLASKHGESWPHPVIAGGRLYLRDQGTLLVYDIRAK
jgi:outer membrane protein assembly factor BamB